MFGYLTKLHHYVFLVTFLFPASSTLLSCCAASRLTEKAQGNQLLPALPVPLPTTRQPPPSSKRPQHPNFAISGFLPSRVISPPDKDCHFCQQVSGHTVESLSRDSAKDLPFPQQVLWPIAKPFWTFFAKPPTLSCSTSKTHCTSQFCCHPPSPNIQAMMTTCWALKAQETHEKQLVALQ